MIDQTSYLDYIKGKRIIFVGACPCLIGKGRGTEIDGYDIVVRTNNFWRPLDFDLIKDYGQRCDVVYTNNQYYREIRPMPVVDMARYGVKWLCMKSVQKKHALKFSKHLNVRRIDTIKVINNLLSAVMGLFIVEDILQYKPEELFITGIDFFASRKPVFEHDNYREYIPGYLPDKIRRTGNIINTGKTKDAHDFYSNASYFNNLFNANMNLKTEVFLTDLLTKIIRYEIRQGEVSWQ